MVFQNLVTYCDIVNPGDNTLVRAYYVAELSCALSLSAKYIGLYFVMTLHGIPTLVDHLVNFSDSLCVLVTAIH